MEIDTLNQIFLENLDYYDSAVKHIRQCLVAYETECTLRISLIAECFSVEDAKEHFDVLEDIQSFISGLVFARNFDVGEKLNALNKEFDRLYDPCIKKYWFDKFKNGEKWPG